MRALTSYIALRYKVSVRAIRPTAALIQVFLVAPATVFMGALFLRAVQPIIGTGRVVNWFSHHVLIGLDIFLIAMPLTAFFVGAGMLLRSWRSNAALRQDALAIYAIVRSNVPYLLIAIATLMAGCILAIVALHMITE
jgi:hypothetical protein